MLINKALDTDTPVLTDEQSIKEAFDLFNRLDVTILPVVDVQTGKLAGQVSIRQLKEAGTDLQKISELTLQEPVKIVRNQHLFKAIHLMLMHELSLLPVINDEWQYVGMIHKKQVLESLTYMLNINKYGSIVTVELEQNDFTLSEIVQIIETEGGKILGITVETPGADKDTYEVSIKLNLKDVSRVASSLRRHEYTVITEAESEPRQLDLETRADELIKYLEV